ncbi:MAG: aspartate aminotransferase family protein [Acidobacteria bacterium]|nr:aspartate aminotransferase family protein [Acidobacteriota bacterium]
MRSYEQSGRLYERAKQSMAGGVSSHFRLFGSPHPLFFTEGHGSRITDADGNEYLDFTLSQGPLILGHSHPAVLRRVAEEMQRGQLFAGQHELELLLAEALQRLIPCAELVRFSNSGSESVQAALRLARAYTGRKKIIKFEGQYHGWFDNVLIGRQKPTNHAVTDLPGGSWHGQIETEGQAKSALHDVVVLPWNDLEAVETVFKLIGDDIAGIITEPVMCNHGCIEPLPGFLQGLRDVCNNYGALLIFDEIITGFRLGLGGAQAYYGVTPDLATIGKAIASGFPLSALLGRREVMELIAVGKVMHAGTYNSNNPTIAAAVATIEELESGGPALFARFRSMGLRLKEELTYIAAARGHDVLLSGPGPITHMAFTANKRVLNYRDCLAFDSEKYGRFVKGMLDNGIRLIGRGIWYISAAHTDGDIDHVITVADEVLGAL